MRFRYSGTLRQTMAKSLAVVAAVAIFCHGIALAGGPEKPVIEDAKKQFQVGAYAIDISPLEFPVIVNGGMTERKATAIVDHLHARCFVMSDGTETIVIAIVDSCMVPRALLDEAKRMAAEATGIRPDRMLISSTHTHSAPSVHGCLGSDVDEPYSRMLPAQIAKGIVEAQKRMVPARIGWAVGRDETNVACRHWVMEPGAAPTNPFGGTKDDTVMMHPGFENPKKIRATGEPDPEIPVINFTTLDGKPLAVLTNYSLHYVGAPAISADYFADVCDEMTKLLGAEEVPTFMAAHSNATSGDMWLMDYTKPRRTMFDKQSVAKEVAAAAHAALAKMEYFDWVPIVMEERLLTVDVRMPSSEEVAAAKEFMKGFEGRKPQNVPEVYARETVLLSEMPKSRELKLQAIRLGDLGIASIPNETYASTGLAIKKASPLKTTMCIELANGCEGYIPPEELHPLGGYTTWRARTACLVPKAEGMIRAELVKMLSKIAELRTNEPSVASAK